MRIIKDTITMLASQGHVTLQVPDGWIGGTPVMEEVPDEWLMRVKVESEAHRPCVGKEQGFLFLTRAGWEANKDRIKAAFDAHNEKVARDYPTHPRKTWADFEAHVDKHFDDMRRLIERKIRNLKAKVAELESAVI